MKPKKALVFIIPLVLGLIGFVVTLIAVKSNWLGVSGTEALEYCEKSRAGWIKQPSNSWSNFAFVFVGWIIAWQAMNDFKIKNNNLFTTTIFFPCFFAIMVVLIGLGSFAFHASTAHLGLFFDANAMYLIASFMFAYAGNKLLQKSAFTFVVMFFSALIICEIAHYKNYQTTEMLDLASLVFGLFLLLAFILEVVWLLQKKRKVNVKWVAAYVSSFLVATFIWGRSKTNGIWCDSESLLQGHAVWHILNALCLYFIYRYYVSEDREEIVSKS